MSERPTHLILCDNNRSRRTLLARMFRAAGCVVHETAYERDVARKLADQKTGWILAVTERLLSKTFCDGYPGVPIVRIGDDHRGSITGRFSANGDGNPALSVSAHALVGARPVAAAC